MDIIPETSYRLHMFFQEKFPRAAYARGFDVIVEDAVIAENFSPSDIVGVLDLSTPVQLTLDFIAGDGDQRAQRRARRCFGSSLRQQPHSRRHHPRGQPSLSSGSKAMAASGDSEDLGNDFDQWKDHYLPKGRIKIKRARALDRWCLALVDLRQQPTSLRH
jgi:hypothetical protein